MGSLAAGSAAAMGTGAFTSASITRTADMSVATDSNAFIQLGVGGANGAGQRIKKTNGELQIDFDGNGADGSGVNDDARYQIGAMDDDDPQGDGIDFTSIHDNETDAEVYPPGEPYVRYNGDTYDQSAFVISNQSGQTLDIEVALLAEEDTTGATVYLQGAASEVDGGSGPSDPDALDGATVTSGIDLSNVNNSISGAKQALSFNNKNDGNEAIPSGESVYVSLQVDTTSDETTSQSLASELVVNAEEAADPGMD